MFNNNLDNSKQERLLNTVEVSEIIKKKID